MALYDDDLSNTRALVVDGNPTSRAILVNQLREFGVGAVEQATRSIDARKVLELKTFDIVLCEQYFQPGTPTGQDLLDDLRRNQLLPFATVFIMVTGEATYAKVAEAAESALDGYLIKPHTATRLAERLYQARQRKAALADIFAAIEAEEFEKGARLCLQRFEARGPFWLYAARIGAELLMRIEDYAQAQKLYEAVIAAKTMPWAKLGVARALLDNGEPTRAISTLENLISDDPRYADAYDVLGRAQFELGNHEQTLAAYRMACAVTPFSISRLQNLGLMMYYSGDRVEAEKILGQCARLGLDSKMFDCQTLVLLAFARLECGDRKGLQHCRDDFVKLIDRDEKNPRLQRQAAIVDALILIMDRQFARAVEAVRAQAGKVKDPAFDFESATNLLALMAQLANKAIQLDDVEPAVDALGLRFSTGRSMSELLAGAAGVHPAYAERLRTASAHALKLAEAAMALSLGGDPAGAVRNLLIHGNETLNAKLIETAHLVLQRYGAKISDAAELQAAVQQWRTRNGNPNLRAALGEQGRPAGGLSLRTARKADGSPAALFAAAAVREAESDTGDETAS
ncbi:response regulator [Curvibacter sp. PAE-UM]|uniref:response regulator n=1 Tax=Curvibacter sp. PAE-UM TaxID=1714344 RepID=UPI000710450B|nr:response regulator [Curvibacter sp. PAE-UM]KRH98649.1 response regulator receiver protein [Curvibacter sp. PAE-UM]